MVTNKLESMLHDIVRDKHFDYHKDTIVKMIKKQYIKNKHFDIYELDSEHYVFIKRETLTTMFGKSRNGATSDSWRIYIFKRDVLFNSHDSIYDRGALVHYIYNENTFIYKASYRELNVLYSELLNCSTYNNNNDTVQGVFLRANVNEDFKIMMNKLISNDIDMLNGA